ncbi:hypothetical protein HDU84_005506 [Entophlyctis sp. JEL0112]|nr:hypothetical protein HDU84_005506 [Entophlyctis sp. JEL0112]
MILHYGDLTDSTNLVQIVSKVRPTEIYNLGAQSHVKVSFDMAEYTGIHDQFKLYTNRVLPADVDGLGTLRLLDAIRICGLTKEIKFYQASTSELYGNVRETPQTENTPFYPRSPYGVAKQYAYWIVVNYREAYNMFACNGILFNHESCLYLGNLDAKRDWGHARDYVEGMYLMLQQNTPEDFVLASGETHSVREFVEKAFAVVGISIRHLFFVENPLIKFSRWTGSGEQEIGCDNESGEILVRVG